MEDLKNYITCCGCYCKTCRAFRNNSCRGCRLGYETEERDINKAKCAVKICCFKEKGLATCADCKEFSDCKKIVKRFKIGSYDYKKCQECIMYIKENGYNSYIMNAEKWKGPWGRLDS